MAYTEILVFVSKILKKWYLYPIGLGLAYFLGKTYLQYKQPVYSANAMILIRDDAESGDISAESLFEDLGIFQSNKNLENEILVLQSAPLMEYVVKENDLQYQYFHKEGISTREIFVDPPVKVASWEPFVDEASLSATLDINESNAYVLTIDEQVFQGEFGSTLELPTGDLTLTKQQNSDSLNSVIISITPPEIKALQLLDRMDFTIVSENSSIISISVQSSTPDKSKLILEQLLTLYNQNSIQEKIQIYDNTIELINNRIAAVAQELNSAEIAVEQYKSEQRMVDAQSEGSMLQSLMAEQNTQLSDFQAQLEILDVVYNFLENEKDFEFVPYNLGISNISLVNQLESFKELTTLRSDQTLNLGPSHPSLLQTEQQIDNLRKTILENINTIRRDLEIQRDKKQDLVSGFETRLQNLPKIQRELTNIERDLGGKQNLYWYLLQKREGAEIAKSTLIPNGKILEPAMANPNPTSPNRAQIWLIVGFLGLSLPTAVVYLLDISKTQIVDEDDIEKLTTVPLSGVLSSKNGRSDIVVEKNTRSAAAEMFRLLRTNINLASSSNGKIQTLIVTSSMSGEGKSYVSLNLAIAQAMAGKKTMLIQLDLRKQPTPFFAEYKAIGITDYLNDSDLKVSDIVQSSKINKKLDFILAGPVSPNPSEELLSDRLPVLFEELKKKYDFIILDTPPVGLVADAFHLKDMADSTMYIVRSKVTMKSQMKIVNDIFDNRKLPRPFIVLNSLSKLHQNSYGAYGKNYYS